MKYIAISAFVASLAIGLMSAGNLGDSAKSKDGKSLFIGNKCQNCHSISSLDIKRLTEPKPGARVPPDLSGVGLKHKESWIAKWLDKEEELNGEKHLKKFKGTDDELTTISTWLASLKKSVAKS
jgi:mono/diheme cytochrome c family protein